MVRKSKSSFKSLIKDLASAEEGQSSPARSSRPEEVEVEFRRKRPRVEASQPGSSRPESTPEPEVLAAPAPAPVTDIVPSAPVVSPPPSSSLPQSRSRGAFLDEDFLGAGVNPIEFIDRHISFQSDWLSHHGEATLAERTKTHALELLVLVKRLTEAQGGKAALARKLAAAEDEVKKLTVRNQNLQDARDRAVEGRTSAEKTLEETLHVNCELNGRIQTFETEVEQLKAEVERLSAKVETSQKAWEEERRAFEEGKSAWEEERKTLEGQRSFYRNGLKEAITESFELAIEQAKLLHPSLASADLTGLDPYKVVHKGRICPVDEADDDEDESDEVEVVETDAGVGASGDAGGEA